MSNIPDSVPAQYRPGLPADTVKNMQGPIPGQQHPMDPAPLDDVMVDGSKYLAAGKLKGKNAIITGGDSGIGRATAVLFAYEGASLLITYFETEEKDAKELLKYLNEKSPSTKVELVKADLSKEEECLKVADKAKALFKGKVDILFNNAATQKEVESILDLPSSQWEYVFATNIHSIFHLTKAVIPMMPWGSSIINNASINPFVGHPKLLDYTSTKGAIVGFTRALSGQIVQDKGIRVNAICPGPIWTPLVVATMSKESMETFGKTTNMGRAGQPVECATCVVFLASVDSSYVSGQCIHCNGGSPY